MNSSSFKFVILFFFQDLNGLDNFVLNEILFRFGGEGGKEVFFTIVRQIKFQENDRDFIRL